MKFQIDYAGTPFLESSKTGAEANRLNWRAEILLTRNQHVIRGRKVLDLASHDGRFSYACLQLGASMVIGVEARPHLVRNAQENLLKLGCSKDSFQVLEDDVFEYLPKVAHGDFDTILCLGFFYHTVRQVELAKEFRRIGPRHLILDTFVEKEGLLSRLINVVSLLRPKHLVRPRDTVKETRNIWKTTQGAKPCLVFKRESTAVEGATIDSIEIVAWPTKSFIPQFFQCWGFASRQLPWSPEEIKDWSAIEDYKKGRRLSYLLDSTSN
jgi:SAM-dependent methyltransferase